MGCQYIDCRLIYRLSTLSILLTCHLLTCRKTVNIFLSPLFNSLMTPQAILLKWLEACLNGVCTIFLIRFFLIGKTSQMFNICYVFPNCIFSDFVMFFLILLGFS